MTFSLYPEEKRWWSFNDYAHVLAVVQVLRPKRVLEFGPGSSTLALIEGGAAAIDCCEDDPDWFRVYAARLEDRFPKIVTMHPYRWADPLIVHGLAERYDLALIDGPQETERRPAVVEFCLQRCDRVLVALECAQGSKFMLGACGQFARMDKRPIEVVETGPLAGAFALIGPA